MPKLLVFFICTSFNSKKQLYHEIKNFILIIIYHNGVIKCL